MKTDKKTIAEIYRHMADNLDSGKNGFDGVQYFSSSWNEWMDKTNLNFDHRVHEYRIKPQTITVNGAEIPKPLSLEELKDKNIYFFPSLTLNLFDSSYRYWLTENQVKFIYKTKEEAIEASKKLFGIE